MVSPRADRTSLLRMGVDSAAGIKVGRFSDGQKTYLEAHRESVFLETRC